MSAPKPGQRKESRRALRLFRHACRGAALWAIAPLADLDAIHSAWLGLDLEVA